MPDDVLGFPHDHEAIAWSHFLAQHLGKAYTEGFVTAFYPPFNVLDKAQSDLYTLRWIETAQGVQLDGIGTIVGLPREIPNSVYLPFFGFTSQESGRGFNQARLRHEREPYATSGYMGDEAYRIAIQVKIGMNNSHGTAEDIMAACAGIFGAETTVYDTGNASIMLLIDDIAFMPGDYRATVIDNIKTEAAGVKLWPYVYDSDNTFGFENQMIYAGFGIGILARSVVSNGVPPITQLGDISLDLNFMTPGVLDSRLTFTRNSIATYFNSVGVLQTAIAHTPRWDYDPVTHRLNGLLIEDARTNLILQSQFAAPWGTGAAVLTPNTVISPDGTVNAATLREDATTAGHYVLQNLTKAASPVTYAVSVFVKGGVGTRNIIVQVDESGTIGVNVIVNPATGAIVRAPVAFGAGWVAGTIGATYTPIGNGWGRIVFSATTASSTQIRNSISLANGVTASYLGDNTSNVYIYGWQIEASAAPSSYIPTTTVAVTRQTDICMMPIGSWYNPLVSSMLAEYIIPIVPNVATGVRSACTINDGTASSRIGIRGIGSTTTTAEAAMNTGAAFVLPTIGTVIANNVMKAAGSWDGVTVGASLNGSYTSATNAGMPAGITMLNIGSVYNTTANILNGWIRRVAYWPANLTQSEIISLTEFTALSFDINFMTPGVLDPQITFTRNSIATYFDSAGLIQTVAINTPRWDYDPVTHALRGLLIEETRINLQWHSGDFTPANWVKNNVTLTAGIPGPNGSATGSGFILNNGVLGYAAQTFTSVAGTTYTASCYAKAGTQSNMAILFNGPGFTGGVARTVSFNLLTGVATVTSGTVVASGMISVGNGWYRCYLTVTTDLIGTINPQFGRTIALGDGISVYYYVFGCQLEAGVFPSSYIPTAGAAVTRAADMLSMSSSEIFNGQVSTLYGEYLLPVVPNPQTNAQIVCVATDGTSNGNRFNLRANTGFGSKGQLGIAKTGATATNVESVGTNVANTRIKFAASYNSTVWNMAQDGLSSSGANVTGAPDSVATFVFGNSGVVASPGNFLNAYLQRVRYWPKFMSADELQALTK